MNITYREEIQPDGRTMVLADEHDGQGEWIFGLLCRDNGHAYIGCIECEQKIEFEAAGMCGPCREDLAWRERADA